MSTPEEIVAIGTKISALLYEARNIQEKLDDETETFCIWSDGWLMDVTEERGVRELLEERIREIKAEAKKLADTVK